MTDTHVGRLLVASLHEALEEVLPQRMEFYEYWLRSDTLRDGTLHVAPLKAVVGFLRAEGTPYANVVARAGVLAADWGLDALPRSRRRASRWLPRRWRLRRAVGAARGIARMVASDTRLSSSAQGDLVRITIDDSIFCSTRASSPDALCGFYLALVVRVLEQFAIGSTGRIERCRAVHGAPCILELDVDWSLALPDPADVGAEEAGGRVG